ncbi:hypothetical protein L0156_02265 [bacterium]|nr:hypothetical protein [bacterium]
MEDLPFPWCVYAEHQSQAARCGKVTHRTWGIENGLAFLLATVESTGVPADQEEFQRKFNTAISTGSWVERNHARLKRKYLQEQLEPHAEHRMLARLRLAELRGDMSVAEWRLLVSIARGFSYHELTKTKVGRARTLISRLRARLCQQDN